MTPKKPKPEPAVLPRRPPATKEAREPTRDSRPKPPKTAADAFALQISVLGKQFPISNVIADTSDLNAKFRNYLALSGLSDHKFLRLSQYSLLRASVANADLLGLDPFLLIDEDAMSPWTVANPYLTLAPHTLR